MNFRSLLVGACLTFGCGGAADQASSEPIDVGTATGGSSAIVSPTGGQTSSVLGIGGAGASQQGSVDGTAASVNRPTVIDVGTAVDYGDGTEDGLGTGGGISSDGEPDGGISDDGLGTGGGDSDDGPGTTTGGVGGTADNVTGGTGSGTSDNVTGGSGNSADNVGGVGNGTSDNVGTGGIGGTADNVGGTGNTYDNITGGTGLTSDNVGTTGGTEDAVAPTPPTPPPPPSSTLDNVGGTSNDTEDAVGGGETLDAPPTAPIPPAPPPAPTADVTSDNIGGTGNTSDLIPPTAPLPPAPTTPPEATGGSISTGGTAGTAGTGGAYTQDCPVSCPPILASGYLGGLTTGGTSGFNTIVLNDATLENVDTQGRVFIGRNFVTPGYTVGSNMPYSTTRYDLVVGGNLTVQASSLWGLTVQNGLIAYGGTLTGSQYINTNLTQPVAGTPPGYVKATPISTSEVTSAMQTWSQELASLTANGNVVGASGFSCPTSVNICVINASAANLISNGTITVTATASQTVIINVSGTSVTIWDDAMTINGGATKNNVIFNLYQATDVSMSGISFQGSMLAPLADLYFTNGNIEGQLIVNNWYMPAGTTAGEVHDYLFNGCPDICIP